MSGAVPSIDHGRHRSTHADGEQVGEPTVHRGDDAPSGFVPVPASRAGTTATRAAGSRRRDDRPPATPLVIRRTIDEGDLEHRVGTKPDGSDLVISFQAPEGARHLFRVISMEGDEWTVVQLTGDGNHQQRTRPRKGFMRSAVLYGTVDGGGHIRPFENVEEYPEPDGGEGISHIALADKGMLIDLHDSDYAFSHVSMNDDEQRSNRHVTVENSLAAAFALLGTSAEPALDDPIYSLLAKDFWVGRRGDSKRKASGAPYSKKVKGDFNTVLRTRGYTEVDNLNFHPEGDDGTSDFSMVQAFRLFRAACNYLRVPGLWQRIEASNQALLIHHGLDPGRLMLPLDQRSDYMRLAALINHAVPLRIPVPAALARFHEPRSPIVRDDLSAIAEGDPDYANALAEVVMDHWQAVAGWDLNLPGMD